MTRPIPGTLNFSALTTLHKVTPTKPETVCRPCWVTWHASRVPSPLGYCWHHRIAWRVLLSGRVRTTICTPSEYRTLLKASA